MKDSQVRKALSILREYKTISNDDEIQVIVEDPWKNMTKLSARLNSEGILTEKIEIVEPSLEDVFVKLSGRKLTEGEN